MTSKFIGTQIQNKIDRLLTPELADKASRHRMMHFREGLDTAIMEANSQVIKQGIPSLDQETFLRIAVRVAEMRTDYIKLGIQISEHRNPDPASIQKLATLRQAYEEMTSVFEAAERVIERGYVKLG